MELRQGFAWWSFAEFGQPEHQLLQSASDIGYRGVDFLPPHLWPAARDHGLELVVADGHEPLEIGFVDPAHHAQLSGQVRRNLEIAAREGVQNLAISPGNDVGLSDSDAIAICSAALAPLAAEAEEAGVTLLVEPLNTTVDHPGYQCNSTAWAAAVVDQVGSQRVRLLYDAYHMQIMEGNLLRTIEANYGRIGHFHTAGVPGRHELDDDQEVNWRAIARWLARTGYQGYVTHEFIPRANPIGALRQAFDAFSVPGRDGESFQS